MAKKYKRNIIREAQVEKTARIVKNSKSYVNKVLNGDRNSEKVMDVFMAIAEGENELLEEVKKRVPFNQSNKNKTS